MAVQFHRKDMCIYSLEVLFVADLFWMVFFFRFQVDIVLRKNMFFFLISNLPLKQKNLWSMATWKRRKKKVIQSDLLIPDRWLVT